MGLSFLPLHALTMTQATKPTVTFHPSTEIKFKCDNSYMNTKLIESLHKENKTVALLPENGWYKTNEEIKHKYLCLINIGEIYRELTTDEFAKYDCGSIHKINHQYYKVIGVGDITYHNELTNEYLKVPVVRG